VYLQAIKVSRHTRGRINTDLSWFLAAGNRIADLETHFSKSGFKHQGRFQAPSAKSAA